jgi:endonuclease/exonuclease/phosphatase (EEP) superfamily protein YafD
VFLAVCVLLPWSWFAIRDLWAPLNAIAVVLPALGLLAGGVLFLTALLRRRPGIILIAISVGLATAAAVLGPRLARTEPDPLVPIRIAFGNVYDDNEDPRGAAEDLLDRGADLVVAVEARSAFRETIAAADTSHPDSVDLGQLLVRSRWPVELLDTPAELPEGRGMLVRVNAPGRSPLQLLVLHLPNPSSDTTFPAQAAELEKIAAIARRLSRQGPLVVVGDLNLSDRTSGYRLLDAELTDAMRAGSFAHNTYAGGIWRFALLRIDHLFVGPGWCAGDPGVFAIQGSDHRGIEASVGPCP